MTATFVDFEGPLIWMTWREHADVKKRSDKKVNRILFMSAVTWIKVD